MSLLGTRYEVGGRTPGVGVDCVGVVLEIYKASGNPLPDPLSVEGHGIVWSEAAKKFYRLTLEKPDPLDVVLIGSAERHVGVALEPGILHAHELAGVVMEEWHKFNAPFIVYRMKHD